MSLAGWTRKVSGKPSMAVGGVGLSKDLQSSFAGGTLAVNNLDQVMERFKRSEFDLLAVGRSGVFSAGLEAGLEAGPGAVAEAEGLGAAAASAALSSYFAAARAPVPSARPNRTLSMLSSLIVSPLRSCRRVQTTHGPPIRKLTSLARINFAGDEPQFLECAYC